MGRPKEVVRKYTLADAEMIEVAEKTRSAFLEDLTDFGTFDNDFKDPFDTNWLNNIAAAKAANRIT